MARRRVTVRGAALLAGLLLLAACAPEPAGPRSTATATSTTPASPSPSAVPSAPPTAGLISIDSPPEGARVPVPVELEGTANTFEAALTVDVLNDAGDILCVRHIMASSGSGTRGTWQARLGFTPEGETEAPVTLRAYEFSASDGSIINLVEQRVILSQERPPIFMTSPVCGEVVAAGGALRVQGRATVFEAALTIELRDAAGDVVFSRGLMTSEGGVESPFGETITVPAGLAAGFYDLVAFNYSAKDGSVENEFPVQISVR